MALTAILAAFCAKDKNAWRGTIEEVNGVTIVRNPEVPVYEGNLFTTEEELSIGGAEGSDKYGFSDISHQTLPGHCGIRIIPAGNKG